MIYRTEAFFWPGRIISHFLIIGVLFAVTQVCAFATDSVTLAWLPSTDTNVVGYNVYYGGASGVYTNKISTVNTTNTIVPDLIEGTTYYFAATAYDSNGVESPFSNEASYALPLKVVPVNSANNPPTLDALGDFAISENPGLQTVNLSGVSSGATNEIQTLTVNAVSSNPALIPTPTVNYTSANTTGTLTFTPASNANGTATITVMVNDGQSQSNTISRTFTVTVNAVNQTPTLNTIANLAINENAGLQTVNLSGIGSGAANETQPLTVSVVSSNPALIPTPTANYTSPNTTGKITLAPMLNANGTATITVMVNDGQTQSNTITRTFTVTVKAVNQPPTLNPIGNYYITQNAGAQTVNLSGISSGAANEKQTLKVTAVSGNRKLVATPTISYSSPGSTGKMTFKPVLNTTGTTTITVAVNDGARSNNIVQRTFKVTILGKGLGIPATLTPSAHAQGQFALNIGGSSGMKYIVQASTNMVDWFSIQTNTAPFTFTDTQAGQFNQRFYRSVSSP